MTADIDPVTLTGWALVLGASSGFGEAASLALARAGLQHLRRPPRPQGDPAQRRSASLADIEAPGREAHFFNVNAADAEKRAEIAAEMERILRERGEIGHAARRCCTRSPSARSSSSSPIP